MSGRQHPGGAGAGTLVVVGTPIGNLGDASPRMAEALRGADAILCEDTRVTARLLACFGISTPLERCDENVIARRVPSLVARLEAGERLAFVSDAGMPCVSDPGQRLVDAALDAGVGVEVVPGPSAVTAAVALSGLPCPRFLFEGFLPRRPGERRRRLEELARTGVALVLYESPHRVADTLADVGQAMPRRRVALVRELTKVHEEVLRGTAGELVEALAAREALRGECVLVVETPREDDAPAVRPRPEVPLDEAALAGLAAGERASSLAGRLARDYGVTRDEAYSAVIAARDRGPAAPTPAPREVP